MKVALLSNDQQRLEFLSNGLDESSIDLLATDNWEEFIHSNAAVYIDLMFEHSIERISMLQQLSASSLIFINYPENTLANQPENFIRINGWNSFLKKDTLEAYTATDATKQKAESVFQLLNKKLNWQNNFAGFISNRIVAMIINEAYLALSEEVSEKADIDAAMKYGTNYPYGPFEWAEIIGLKKIGMLLAILKEEHIRYTPSMLIVEELNK